MRVVKMFDSIIDACDLLRKTVRNLTFVGR